MDEIIFQGQHSQGYFICYERRTLGVVKAKFSFISVFVHQLRIHSRDNLAFQFRIQRAEKRRESWSKFRKDSIYQNTDYVDSSSS